MGLPNATCLRIDRASGTGATGIGVFVIGAAIQVRCRADSISNNQRYELGAVIRDAVLSLSVKKSFLAEAGEAFPVQGMRLSLQIDGEDAVSMEVVHVDDYVLGGPDGALTRWILFLKKV